MAGQFRVWPNAKVRIEPYGGLGNPDRTEYLAIISGVRRPQAENEAPEKEEYYRTFLLPSCDNCEEI